MVQIPEFKAKTQITSQTGTRARPVVDIGAAAAAPFEAAARLAGDVQKISSRFYEAQTSLQRKTETSKLIDQYLKGNENTPGLNQLSFDAQNNPDTNVALQNYQQGYKSLLANLSNGVKDPVVKRLFEDKANEIYNNEYLNVQSSVWKNIREQGQETLKNNINLETNKILNAGGNKAQEFASRINIEKLIEDANKDGLGLPENYFETTLRTIDLRKADNLVTENPNLFMQNLDSGYYNDKIDPKNLMIFKDRAIGKQESMLRTAIADVKTEVSDAKSNISDLVNPLKKGKSIGVVDYQESRIEALSVLQKALNFGQTDLAQEISESIEDLDVFYENSGDIQSATFYTRNDLIDSIKVEEEKIGNIEDTKQKLRQENKVENLKKILTTMNEEMDDNMIGYYQSIRENIAVPEIDLLDANMPLEAIFTRNTFAQKVRNELDPRSKVQYFTKNEKKFITETLENGNRDEIKTLLKNMSLIAGDDNIDVLSRLNVDNPALAHLGLLLIPGETPTTTAILEGYIKSRDKDNVKVFNAFQTSTFGANGLMSIKFDLLTPDFRNQHPKLSTQITEAADYIFMNMVINDKELVRSKGEKGNVQSNVAVKLYNKAIQMAAGMTYKEGSDGKIKAFGGFHEYKEGNYILLPQNIANSDLSDGVSSVKELLENNLTDDLLSQSLSSVPYDPMSKTEIPLMSFFNEDGGLKDSLYLETIGDGEYYITYGNPVTFNTAYYKDKQGKPIIFNMRSVGEELMKRKPLDENLNIPELSGSPRRKKK
jgi:phage shock protein A